MADDRLSSSANPATSGADDRLSSSANPAIGGANTRFLSSANPDPLPPPSPTYHANIHVGDIFEQRDFLSAPVGDAAGDRTRPNLKIQDGCNNRCSFCIIPFVRGRSRSAPAARVVEQVRDLARRYREVVLSGINLGRWGRDGWQTTNNDGLPHRLADLIRLLLAETDIERLRLSSVEPMDFSDDLLGLMAASPRLAPHVHAPLQSGSDRILRRMHRKYRPRHYADRILKARRLMPDAAIGADVMVGFPGETDADFEESRAFHRFPALHLSPRLHLFRAPRHARRGASRFRSHARPQAAQPRAARAGCGQEPRIPPRHDRPHPLRRHPA